MEQTPDVNETIYRSTESAHFKRKSNDNPSQQSQSCGIHNSSATILLAEMNRPDHISTFISPDLSLERLATESLFLDSDSKFGHEAHCTSLQSSKFHGDMVTELTIGNYKSPNLTAVHCHTNGMELQLTKVTGQDHTIGVGVLRDSLYETLPTLSKREDIRDLFVSHLMVQRSFSCSELDQEHSVDKCTVSDSTITRSAGEIQEKVPLVHGSSQFGLENILKGKEVSFVCPAICNEPDNILHLGTDGQGVSTVQLAPNVLARFGVEADSLSLGDSSCRDVFGSCKDGISLRDYLKPTCDKFDEVERLLIFKQIVVLVHRFHSKGFALKHLRPSYFVILPSKHVKYVGSLFPESQLDFLAGKLDQDRDYSQNNSKRTRCHEEGEWIGGSSSLKYLKASPSTAGFRQEFVENSVDFDEIQKLVSGSWGELQPFEAHKNCNALKSMQLSSVCDHKTRTDILKLEERWYASPEELKGISLFCSSNIYNIGVLLFELFGEFESFEAHVAAMSDLQHRILPPKFIYEHLKESAICLWMLHPESSSRPKTRDILHCKIFFEDGNPLTDQLSSYVEEDDADTEVLSYFLLSLKKHKEKQAGGLKEDLQCLEADIEDIEKRYFSGEEFFPILRCSETHGTDISDINGQERPSLIKSSKLHTSGSNETSLTKNFDKLEHFYFSMRSKLNQSHTNSEARSDLELLNIQNHSDQSKASDLLESFFEGLHKYSRYTKFCVRGCLRTAETFSRLNVICSLSFDKNEDYLATAGVSKTIKIFEFDPLLNGMVDIHFPIIEMSNKSKLSCICWNNYIRNYLASTDYDGIVQLWDANTGQVFTHYTEHQKRAWSVDFSHEAPTKLASGGDDCAVKLWSIHEKNSIKTIKTIGNVCCVQFSNSSHLLAFGSADCRIYCYDLRHTRIPWCSLVGHGRAVSDIKFVDSGTLVSTSTDSTVKLWDLRKTCAAGLSTNACCLTMTGHINEKNFVGLSVWDGYIVCGSESNEVYAYHRTLPMPIASHKCGQIDTITGQESAGDNGKFVSSVCWRTKSDMVVAANSNGCIKILEMV